jgi:hypothetical protein
MLLAFQEVRNLLAPINTLQQGGMGSGNSAGHTYFVTLMPLRSL